MQLASLYEFQGKFREARDQCLTAVALCQENDRSNDEAFFHYLLGELAGMSSQRGEYEREMTRSEQLCGSPFIELPLVGMSYARHGRLTDARRVLEKILSLSGADPYVRKHQENYARLVRGEMMLQSGEAARARDEFRGVQRLHSGDPIYLLAQPELVRCEEIQGDTDVVNACLHLLSRRGEAVMGFVRSIRSAGFWTRQLWPEVDLILGKYYLRQHDSTLAQQHLQQCLGCWSHADAGDTHAREAARIVAQLTKSR